MTRTRTRPALAAIAVALPAAATAAALLVATGCTSALEAQPFTIDPAALEHYEAALARREAARHADDEAARDGYLAALAEIRAARAASPADFRLALLEQDLEFDLDRTAARERYARRDTESVEERTLAARALLPERTEEALAMLEDVCIEKPDFAWGFYGRAFIERVQGKPDAALEHALKALRLDPTLVEALRMLAEIFQSGGDREHAIEARQLLVEVSGGDLQERYLLSHLLLAADDKSDATDAEMELRVILAALGDPPPPERRGFRRDALIDLGTAYSRRGQYRQAIDYWRQALAVDPDALTALYNIGIVELQERDDPRQALAAFEEYLARAQAMTSLPADQLFYRHLSVPNQVLELKQRLGIATSPPGGESPAPPEPGGS